MTGFLRILAAIFAPAMIAISILGIPLSYAQSNNPHVFPIDSDPYGISYGEWTAKWWDWFLRIPADMTPADDPTGSRCGVNQHNPDMWYVTGNFGGDSERECTVPYGRAILVNIVANECNRNEYPDLQTDVDLSECASAGNAPNSYEATFDGVATENLASYRIKSPFFESWFPENNVFGATPGPTRAISDGYFIIIKPPSVGTHELHFSQLTLDDPITGVPGFAYSVMYHINIVEAKFETSEQAVVVANQSIPLTINSSSTITDFAFSEEEKRISFKASESSVYGVSEIPIGSVLTGTYTLLIDGNPVHDYKSNIDEETGVISISIAYPEGAREITLIGTNVVPEFSTLPLIALAMSVSFVVFMIRFHGHWNFLSK